MPSFFIVRKKPMGSVCVKVLSSPFLYYEVSALFLIAIFTFKIIV